MRITLLNDTSDSVNWGCQATSYGLKDIIKSHFQDAQFNTVTNPKLPMRLFKPYRTYFNGALLKLLSENTASKQRLHRQLKGLNFPEIHEPLPDRIYLNGEGMLHAKSGHLPRLLGTLMHYKNHGVWVGAINQTIDLPGESLELEVLVQVFNSIDHVTVRDPYSYELLRGAGVKNCQLVPDAAFYCAVPESEEVETVRRQFDLPKKYIALTGSSVLSVKSFEEFFGIYKTVKKKTNMPIVLLGNTKTDYQLSEKVSRLDPSSILISNHATFRQAMAVIAGAEFFVSGRFHPIIFAARAGTAIIPLTANTHKNQGLLKLLEYPVDAIDWHAPMGIERGFEALAESSETGRQAVQKAAKKLCLETFRIVG